MDISLLYKFCKSFVKLFEGGVVWIYGNYLAQIVLGFAVILLCIIEFVEAEKSIAVSRVGNKAGT